MKKRLNPTEIFLKELPAEGREYEYDHDSAELTPALEELIQHNPYSVRLTVRPTGNVYDVQGSLKTSLDLQCSLCAMDIKFPVERAFHEILLIQKPLHKDDQNVKVNHSSEWDESQPEGIYLEGPVFDVAGFIHELIAIAEPMRPLGKPDCEKGCENLQDSVQRDWLNVGPKDSKSVRNNPFSILGKVKLKS